MKVTQEKLPASQVGLEIEVTPEMSKQVYDRVLQEFTRSTNIPGFRKGKVPKQILIQSIGPARIKAAAVEELVESGLKQAVKQENLEVLGNYQLRSSFDDLVNQFEPGQTLTFSASVDVKPDVTLQDYTGLQLQVEEVKPDPGQVNQTLHKYQDQLATLVPVEGRPAQLKDVAIVDFTGVLPSDDPEQEPEEVPGGQAEDFQLELLESGFIPGFVDGIVGMTPGETKEVEATFPEEYPQPTVAGQKAIFTVTLKELKEKELPELDDEFAQEVSEFETLADLQASLEKQLAEEAEEKTRSNREQAILAELLSRIEVDLPETLIEREVDSLIQQTAFQMQNRGIDVKKFFSQELVERLRQQYRPDAIVRIKRTLALSEIAKREGIEASESEISEKVKKFMADLGDHASSVDMNRVKEVLSDDVLKEKIINWLIEHSTIEMVPEGTLSQDTEVTDDPGNQPFTPQEEVDTIAGTAIVDVTAEAIVEPSSEADSPESEPVEE